MDTSDVQVLRFQPFEPADYSFVGRAQELAQLEDWWQRGGQTPAFVWGPRGMGKTSLINRFAATLHVPLVFRTLDRSLSPNDAVIGDPSGATSLLVIDNVDQADLDRMDYQMGKSKPVAPASASVGTSGSNGERRTPLTPSARSVPATRCGAAIGISDIA
jgi:hypothetical protein